MNRFLWITVVWSLAFCSLRDINLANAAPNIDWTVAIYAGLDEEEIDRYAKPILREILGATLGENTELFLEKDGYGDKYVYRYYRQGSEIKRRTTRPEHDSASPVAFEHFLRWVNDSATGTHRMLIVMTHSWGWKGIIQDFSSTTDSGSDTMMTLASFANTILRTSTPDRNGLPFDVMFLDSCILGNAEPLTELVGTARYVVASQRETPYSGYPYKHLFSRLAKAASPYEVARGIPRQYVEAFARGGERVEREGEYFTVSAASVDLEKWKPFVDRFKSLVQALSSWGFRDELKRGGDWIEQLTDEDHNIDLVTLLRQITTLAVGNPSVQNTAQTLLREIAYPEEVSQSSARTVAVDSTQSDLVKFAIPIDEYVPQHKLLAEMTKRWKQTNQDLAIPEAQSVYIDDQWFEVSIPVVENIKVRPWLVGTRLVKISERSHDGVWTTRTLQKQSDMYAVDGFSDSSFLIAEAHTSGLPLIHGIGISLNPLMTDNEEHATDPDSGLVGPSFYRSLRWNQLTGWGDLTLLDPLN